MPRKHLLIPYQALAKARDVVFNVVAVYHYAIKAIMFLNGLRLALRMLTVYGGINVFPGNGYDALYLPLVYITFGGMAWWFFRSSANIFILDERK